MKKILFAIIIFLSTLAYGQKSSSEIKLRSFLADSLAINSKNVEIAISVLNNSKKSIKISNSFSWGFRKLDNFSDFIVDLQKIDSSSTYQSYPIPDISLPPYNEIKLVNLKSGGTLTDSLNIAHTFDAGLEKGLYKVRVLFKISKHNRLPDTYSNWTYFLIQ